jgi:hypothetical protein
VAVSSNPRPKSLALMFLLGAFLTGGAVGFVADRAVNLSHPPHRQFDERMMRDSLARELHLTDAQRHAVDSIYDWRHARTKELMDSVRPSFDATRDSARVLLMKVFDPTQQADFRKIIARSRASDSTRRTRESSR